VTTKTNVICFINYITQPSLSTSIQITSSYIKVEQNRAKIHVEYIKVEQNRAKIHVE